jgi:prevent-host-death family protein
MTMRTTTLADAKAHLSEIIASAQSTHERVTITKNGRPAVVVVSIEDYESLEETLFWLSHPDAAAATEEADRGEFATAEEVRKTLGDLGLPLPDSLR